MSFPWYMQINLLFYYPPPFVLGKSYTVSHFKTMWLLIPSATPSLPVQGWAGRGAACCVCVSLSTVSPCEGQCQCQGWGYPLQGREGGSVAWVKLFLIPMAGGTWHPGGLTPHQLFSSVSNTNDIVDLIKFWFTILQAWVYTWPLIYEQINDQILKFENFDFNNFPPKLQRI